jgi:hypothetical protein
MRHGNGAIAWLQIVLSEKNAALLIGRFVKGNTAFPNTRLTVTFVVTLALTIMDRNVSNLRDVYDGRVGVHFMSALLFCGTATTVVLNVYKLL